MSQKRVSGALLDRSESASDSGIAGYLREISHHELLTAHEERELARRLARGQSAARRLAQAAELSMVRQAVLQRHVALGQQARQRLVESNLRLVVSIARQFVGLGLSLPDLIQEGNIGLQTGIERFDWRKGFRLSTYAYWWIRQAMTRALANDSRLIRLPAHAGDLLRQAAQAEHELATNLGRQPSLAELAEHLSVDPERLRRVRLMAARPTSLDAPLPSTESGLTCGDLLADDAAMAAVQSGAEAHELREDLATAVEKLPPREREVVRLRYGVGRPDTHAMAEVAVELGVTRERVRQLEVQALRKLRADTGLRQALLELQGGDSVAARWTDRAQPWLLPNVVASTPAREATAAPALPLAEIRPGPMVTHPRGLAARGTRHHLAG